MLKEGTKFHPAGKYLKLRKLKSFRNTWNLSAILCPSFSMRIQTGITAEIYSHTSLVAWKKNRNPAKLPERNRNHLSYLEEGQIICAPETVSTLLSCPQVVYSISNFQLLCTVSHSGWVSGNASVFKPILSLQLLTNIPRSNPNKTH